MKHPFAALALAAVATFGDIALPPVDASSTQTEGCHSGGRIDTHITVAWTWCDRVEPLFMQRNRTLLFNRPTGTFFRKRGPWRCIDGFAGRSPVFFNNDANLWIRSTAVVTLLDSRCVD